MNLGLGSLRWYFQITGIHANLSEPTLSVETHKEIKNKVVIFRSARRNNFYINYKFLRTKDFFSCIEFVFLFKPSHAS